MVFDNGVYRDETPEELAELKKLAEEQKAQEKKQQIIDLKEQLASTDYKALKYFEGWLSDEEYAPIKAERQKIRDKINELESEQKHTFMH